MTVERPGDWSAYGVSVVRKRLPARKTVLILCGTTLHIKFFFGGSEDVRRVKLKTGKKLERKKVSAIPVPVLVLVRTASFFGGGGICKLI